MGKITGTDLPLKTVLKYCNQEINQNSSEFRVKYDFKYLIYAKCCKTTKQFKN